MAKMNVKHAYRNIPVHPADSRLLGMKWASKTYIDRVLPFGLRSAPLIFSAVADALQWMMEQRGATWVRHYVDDFITVGPNVEEYARNAEVMHKTCEEANIPVEPEKDEGPARVITFLGLQLDTVKMEVRLPQEKLEKLKELANWKGRKAGRKRDLLSLIGLLTHAGKAVKPGRAYVRRLIDLSSVASQLDHFIRINREARADLEWWHHFLGRWNGVAMMTAGKNRAPDIVVTSDASGSWGCGTYSGSQWFQPPWSNAFVGCHITVKELAPTYCIVIAAIVWRDHWRGKSVLARCDNSAVVAIIKSNTSRNTQAANLLRCLAFLAATYQFELQAVHLGGKHNILADALSRNKLMLFRSLNPQADRCATSVPEAALDLILLREPDWTARDWTNQWTSSWTMP